MAAVGSRHGDRPANAVRPVQVSVDPVESDALGGRQVAADHHAVVRGVFGRVGRRSGMTAKSWSQAWGVGSRTRGRPLSFRRHSRSPVDLLLGDVRPVDLVGGDVHVEGHDVLQPGDHAGVLTSVQRHLSDFVAVGEEKVGYRT